MEPKNILITGGAGFIGSHLALRLLEQGHTVTVLDNLSPQVHSEGSPLYGSIKDKVRFILGDVRSKDDWAEALRAQDAVVHFAAETGTGQSMYEIDRYVDVNVRGTGLLLDLLANTSHQVKKLLVASSRSIYGEGKAHCSNCGVVYPKERREEALRARDFNVKCPNCGNDTQPLATDENSLLHPSSIYGITKQTQEQLVLTGGRALGIGATALRYQNVYGPGQSLSNPYTGILSIFSTRILNGNGITVFEDGTESRDFVYIDDVVNATCSALFSEAASGKALNIGSGTPVSVQRVAEVLSQAYGRDVEIKVTGNFRVGDIRHNYADLSQSQSCIGFHPQVSFIEGAERFTAWVKRQKLNADTYEQSIDEMKRRGLFS